MKVQSFGVLKALVAVGVALGGEGMCLRGSISAAAEAPHEWKALMHGDSLDGWKVLVTGSKTTGDPERIFSVKDGVVHAFQDTPQGKEMPFAGLFTDEEYSRYHLRLSFRWGTKKFAPRTELPRDSGIFFHVTRPDRIWPQGVECQVQEGDIGDIYAVDAVVNATIDPKTANATGPVPGLPSPVFMDAAAGGVPWTRPFGNNAWRVRRDHDWEHEGWNTIEMIVDGDRAVFLVNGKVNNRCTHMRCLDPDNPQRAIPLDHGRILLQAEGAEWFSRDIEIKDISDAERVILGPKRSLCFVVQVRKEIPTNERP